MPSMAFLRPREDPKDLASKQALPGVRNKYKNELLAVVAEYTGTTLFLMFAFGVTNVANVPTSNSNSSSINQSVGSNPSQLLYISLGFGFSLAVNAWVFFRVSGGLFNPAVSFALMLIGAITPIRCLLITFAEILGGMTAAALVSALSPGSLNVSCALVPGMSIARGLFLEMFLTSFLVLTIIMLAAEKHKATFTAPIGIGLALFVAELWGVYYTGGALNPARAFGPAVTIRSFHGYHWIYWVGPYLGGFVAAVFYFMNKSLHFEGVNPGQDDDPSQRRDMKAALQEKVDDGTIEGKKSSRERGERGPHPDIDDSTADDDESRIGL